MKIFIYGATLTGFTSSIPMRGLVIETIKLRSKDDFVLYFNANDRQIIYLKKFFNELNQLKNIDLIFNGYSKKFSNFKILLGFSKYLDIRTKADLYISPGTLDFFGKNKLPLINILADLSSIRVSQYASTPWHGKYIFRNLLQYSVKYASKIICESKFTRKDLNKLYPCTKNKTLTIYNGIEREWFDTKYEKTGVEGFTNSDSGYWIWYGYISKRKNIMNLLKAYKSLKDENSNRILPKLLLIGKLAPNQSFMSKYIHKHLDKFVKIVPYQDIYHIKYLVNKSKGLVFPSYYEGFGLPVIEAFSQGVPVMHSNVSSLPEIANGLGVSCDPYDIESIKSALMNLLNDKFGDEIQKKRKIWASNFTYRNAAVKFSKMIDEMNIPMIDKSFK